jgi:hypothetical protein
MDPPVWQELYASLNDPSFEIISVAEDSQGESAAGPWFDRANATYRCVIDETHKISTLFGWVNVPSGAWIDEDGRIVRINEGVYAGAHTIKKGPITVNFGSEVYGTAVRDWVTNGAESKFVWSAEEVRAHLKPSNDSTLLADPTFKMGLHFKDRGDDARAETYFKQAQRLAPDNWNYHRQSWTYAGETSAFMNWYKKAHAPGAGRYYDAMGLDGEPDGMAATPEFVGSGLVKLGRKFLSFFDRT